MGITLNPTVQANQTTLDIVRDVREVYAGHFVITSAVRTPELQAKLMIRNYNLGTDIAGLYGKDTTKIIATIQDNNKQQLVEYLRVHKTFSSHLCGNALDISLRGLKKDAIRKIKSLQKDKYRVIIENTPPHIHIETLKGC